MQWQVKAFHRMLWPSTTDAGIKQQASQQYQDRDAKHDSFLLLHYSTTDHLV
jgi:hypothetical protein